MTKHKKVSTLDLIQQMTEKNKETVEVLENIKNERSSTSSTDIKQQLGPKDVRKKAESNISMKIGQIRMHAQPENSFGILERLEVLLNTENFPDKKETFTLSLSRDCLEKYEKLAMGTSYKLEIKTTRNDLVRKVLEDFIDTKYVDLTRLIDQK